LLVKYKFWNYLPINLIDLNWRQDTEICDDVEMGETLLPTSDFCPQDGWRHVRQYSTTLRLSLTSPGSQRFDRRITFSSPHTCQKQPQ
jgi:hypothetical protein